MLQDCTMKEMFGIYFVWTCPSETNNFKLGLVNDNHLKTGFWQNLEINRSFATTVSQLKFSDFSGHNFKSFEVP